MVAQAKRSGQLKGLSIVVGPQQVAVIKDQRSDPQQVEILQEGFEQEISEALQGKDWTHWIPED